MRFFALFIAVLLALGSVSTAPAQSTPRHVDLEVEPVAFLLGGAGGHVGVQLGAWSYTLEVFRLTVPASLHGNDGFEASPLGAELHFKRFFGRSKNSFYAGPEVGVNWFTVTHEATGESVTRTQYSVGLRGGYRWYPGLGDLYLSPVAGLTYTLNPEAVDIQQDTFETGPFTPFVTVGLGWSF